MTRQFTEDRMDMKNDPWVGIEANTDFFEQISMEFDVSVCNSPWYQITDQWTFQEEAYYSQTTLQLKFDIFGNICFRLFNYNVEKYNAKYLPAISLPGIEADIDPEEYFYPGLGAPVAILTSKALMYSFKRDIGQSQDIELNLKGLVDLENSGYLTEIGAIFTLSDNLRFHTYLNKVIGDDTLDDEYRFNQMKDFSHLRFELEYFF